MAAVAIPFFSAGMLSVTHGAVPATYRDLGLCALGDSSC